MKMDVSDFLVAQISSDTIALLLCMIENLPYSTKHHVKPMNKIKVFSCSSDTISLLLCMIENLLYSTKLHVESMNKIKVKLYFRS